MVCGKKKYTKTESRDKNSKWARSRLAICKQFKEWIRTRKARLEATLWVDEHSEFCVLGKGAHHGNASRWEWRAPLNEEGQWGLQRDGGVLEPSVPQRKAKNPARADGIFGVCASIPQGGRRRRGRRMRPKRYQGLVVGMKTYSAALEAELEPVRKLGMANQAKYYNPDTNSTK